MIMVLILNDPWRVRRPAVLAVALHSQQQQTTKKPGAMAGRVRLWGRRVRLPWLVLIRRGA